MKSFLLVLVGLCIVSPSLFAQSPGYSGLAAGSSGATGAIQATTLQVGSGTTLNKVRRVTATLVSGTVTVSDTTIAATTGIYVTNYTTTGTPGVPYVSNKTAGTGYTITSGNSAATNQVEVLIID